METGIPGKIRKIREALSEDDPLWIPWNDIIPLIFLILMFSLESKLVFLVLWIVSLIALALYLICVEYIHDKMLKQLAATGMTTEDLIRGIKEEKGV